MKHGSETREWSHTGETDNVATVIQEELQRWGKEGRRKDRDSPGAGGGGRAQSPHEQPDPEQQWQTLVTAGGH